ncbi:hypothetical protein G3N56_03405 [Desulfovibrio sulfodismutans]|uniref:Uncharacterized protein n=1 Tax=Desulfolutivibrio sulfodismutans TaxID=63561 RepID=A0A7K3NKQ1_9BACT|nr:hypothetical protein [Desulfolutivibrio sulfodismutans]NDY55789.1 hypothetical protein [Desulfolutivibrio sulfodismutans]QLA13406.1 hypothetical protein GD606_14610 [Desulfolutivibrio sulfodismutans DSM 3696]
MGSLRQAVESTFAGVAYAERNMDGEAKRILEEDGEDSQPRKRAERQMAGQACRKRVRAE